MEVERGAVDLTQYYKEGDTTYQVIDGVVRREDPKYNGQYREWHANGVLAREFTRVNGVPTGIAREWHDNGVLAREEPFVAGRVHGTVRQWNREGRLLGEYTLTHGRGVERVWNEDGSLQREYEQISDSGARGAVWDDLHQRHEVFLWNGKSISKKKFLERIAKESARNE